MISMTFYLTFIFFFIIIITFFNNRNLNNKFKDQTYLMLISQPLDEKRMTLFVLNDYVNKTK